MRSDEKAMKKLLMQQKDKKQSPIKSRKDTINHMMAVMKKEGKR